MRVGPGCREDPVEPVERLVGCQIPVARRAAAAPADMVGDALEGGAGTIGRKLCSADGPERREEVSANGRAARVAAAVAPEGDTEDANGAGEMSPNEAASKGTGGIEAAVGKPAAVVDANVEVEGVVAAAEDSCDRRPADRRSLAFSTAFLFRLFKTSSSICSRRAFRPKRCLDSEFPMLEITFLVWSL